MTERNLDLEILKLIEEQPEISDSAIADNLSVSEELIKARITSFQDTREKILIADDDPEALTALKKVLEAENYSLAGASDGFSALEAVKSQRPDIVLLDLMLPGIDGFEVCRQLKGDPLCRHVPVMMLSSRDEVEARIEGFETGAEDFILKPVNPLELKTRIRMILRRNWA
ncbi:TPA: response regulator transcription factor [Methanosarcinaceae archaeon]|nr:response regulator transcription factor [Methanosarcinaceae archaeon]